MVPWALLFQLAAQKLCWPPEAFWRATPKELALALGLGDRRSLLDKRDLKKLMDQHPDDRRVADTAEE